MRRVAKMIKDGFRGNDTEAGPCGIEKFLKIVEKKEEQERSYRTKHIIIIIVREKTKA